MAETSTEVVELKARIAGLEAQLKESEGNLLTAAQYGRDLLYKNKSQEEHLEEKEQDVYELNLKLQAKLEVERSLSCELELAGERQKHLEESLERQETEEMERTAKREDLWRARLSELEAANKAAEAKCAGLEERLRLAEKQLEDTNGLLNQSVGGKSFSEEVHELHTENLALVQRSQALEADVARLTAELETERAAGEAAKTRIACLEKEQEELECQITSYIRMAEAARDEVTELEAQLEAARAGQFNQDDKGNSLFSEVEDRRQLVENKMVAVNSRYELLKASYDAKVEQLKKVKLHNVHLMSMAGSRSDSAHSARLEELLTAEREKNKELSTRLDALESLSGGGKKKLVGRPALPAKEPPPGDEDTAVVEGHTDSEEYSYLTGLLTQVQEENSKLHNELRTQVRQNLADSDKLRELSRQAHGAEQQIHKLKADNYTLKLQLDDIKSRNGDRRPKRERKKIVEMIKFESPAKANVELVAEQVHESLRLDEQTNKENLSTNVQQPGVADGESKVKKSVRLMEVAEEIDGEGEKKQVELNTETKEKVKKPKGKKHFSGQNAVVMADEEPGECKQQ